MSVFDNKKFPWPGPSGSFPYVGSKVTNFVNAIRVVTGKGQPLTADERKQNEGLLAKLRKAENDYYNRTLKKPPDFNAMFPETLGKEQKTYTAKSDEQVKSEAENMYVAGYGESVAKATKAHDKSLETNSNKAEDASVKAEARLLSADASEANQLKNQQNKMIAQGMTDSSVYELGREAISAQAEAKRAEVMLGFRREEERLRAQRELLEKEYAESIASFNLKYALNVEKATAKIFEQEQKLKADIEAYNARIAKEEEAYQKKRATDIHNAYKDFYDERRAEAKEIEEHERLYGYTTKERVDEMAMRFEMAKAFYDNYSKARARVMIKEQVAALKALLGTSNFAKLNALYN